MISIDIQRGRDLGVRGYNDYRHLCGMKPAKKFEDFLDVMDVEVLHSFKFYAKLTSNSIYVCMFISESSSSQETLR